MEKNPQEKIKVLTEELIKTHNRQLTNEQGTYRMRSKNKNTFAIGINSSGKMSKKDCIANHRPLFSGIAPSCISAAVVHPQIGMGVALLDSYSQTDMHNFLSASLNNDSGFDIKQLNKDMRSESVLKAWISMQSLTNTVIKAVVSAAGEFLSLNQGTPEGTLLLLSGGFFINQPDKNQLDETARNTIVETGISESLNFFSRLGTNKGIIFGYPHHQYFQGIGFYDFNNFETVP